MAEVTDAEKEARRQYDNAKRVKEELKRGLKEGYGTLNDSLKQVDRLWSHIQDFVPRHWREDGHGNP